MEDISLINLFGRLIFGMAVVLGIMVMAARVLKKRGLAGGARRGRPAPVELLARQALGRTSSVALVRAGGKVLVLGVTESSVNLLGEADPDSIESDGPGADWTALPGDNPVGGPGWTWKAMLDAARERTIRRS